VCASLNLQAQYINGTLWPTDVITIPTDGSSETVTTCAYTNEYSVVDNILSGSDYEISCTLGGDHAYITVTDDADTPIAHGPSPFTWTSTIAGTVHLHYSDDAACASTSSCHTVVVTCSSCTPPPPPSNDACSDAIDMSSGVLVQGTIESATDVEGLSPCSSGGGGDAGCVGGDGLTIDWSPGVWFSYTSTGADTITIDLGGSLFDTEVQVFSGSCGNLTCVGGDDDGGSTGNFESKFCWVSTASFAPVTYYIYVDGHGGATGIFDALLTVQEEVLPIELVSFDATAMERGNKVTWTTASELNNEYQIVEKSYGAKDDWMEVVRVETKGDSEKIKSYEVMDDSPGRMTYYRLRSVDFDGYTEYSGVVSVEREMSSSRLLVSPNPTAGILNVETDLQTAGSVTVTVIDTSGKVISNFTLTQQAGTNVHPYDMADLPAGMYILNVKTDSEIFVERIIKE